MMTLLADDIVVFASFPRIICLFYDLGIGQDMTVPAEKLGLYISRLCGNVPCMWLFIIMTVVARIWFIINSACPDTLFRGNELECMTVLMPLGLRHMTRYATAEGMNPVCR